MNTIFVSIMLVLGLVLAPPSFSAESTPHSQNLKIIYYNVDAIDSGEKFMSESYSYPHFDIRLKNILKRIETEDADVVSLSEAAFFDEHKEQLIQGFKEIGFEAYSPIPGTLTGFYSSFSSGMRSFFPSTFVYRNSGLIIFVNKRHQLAKCETHTYTNSSGRDLVANKGALFCEIHLNSSHLVEKMQVLYIISTHFQAGGKEEFYAHESQARLGQFVELKNFIKSNVPLKEKPFYLVGGDLNFDFGSKENTVFNEILNGKNSNEDTLHLQNLHVNNVKHDSRPNYNTAVDWDVIIDHVYVPVGYLEDTSIQVSDVFSQDIKYTKKITNSDHKMLIVEIPFSSIPTINSQGK